MAHLAVISNLTHQQKVTPIGSLFVSKKREFIIKLEPPRPNFNENTTEEEKRIIGEHFTYLQTLLDEGTLVFAGRCDDATFGLIILESDSLENAKQVMKNDPAVKAGVFSAEIWSFRTALSR